MILPKHGKNFHIFQLGAVQEVTALIRQFRSIHEPGMLGAIKKRGRENREIFKLEKAKGTVELRLFLMIQKAT
jgi:hypothetical protein